jgi:protein-tyrosine phosphatase
MIDIHCHLMPGVDDGSRDLDESLAMFENAYTSGVTSVVLTPHYIKDTKYNYKNSAKQGSVEILREALRRTDVNIEVYYGNEAYLDDELPELIEKGEVSTLANSRYLLVELPVNAENKNAGNILFRLKSNGITPIIAHPERYIYIQQHPEKVKDFLKIGCLLQGNYMSLFGKYGKKAKKTLKILLKEGYISFLCSDIHHKTNEYLLPEAEKKVQKILKNDSEVQKLFIENAEAVIKNEVIEGKR